MYSIQYGLNCTFQSNIYKWDIKAQQNRDWAALVNPEIDTLDPNFEKTTISHLKENIYLCWLGQGKP